MTATHIKCVVIIPDSIVTNSAWLMVMLPKLTSDFRTHAHYNTDDDGGSEYL